MIKSFDLDKKRVILLKKGTMKQYYILVVILLCITNSAHAIPKPDKIVKYKTIDQINLSLHIFFPPNYKSTDKKPAIVFFHGGGWLTGHPLAFYNHCEYFASRGMLTISVQYRTLRKNNTSPKECVKDAKSAIRWIRRHADKLGIDPNRLAAGGGSAGGHMAAAAATLEKFNEKGEDTSVSCRPDALLLFNPVFDNGPKGYGYKRVKEYWEEFSPLHNIHKKTPPTIVFLGTQDKHIDVSSVKEYEKRMGDYGLRCDSHIYRWKVHGFFQHDRKSYYDTILKTDKFLISLGYLDGNPTLRTVQEKAPPPFPPTQEYKWDIKKLRRDVIKLCFLSFLVVFIIFFIIRRLIYHPNKLQS